MTAVDVSSIWAGAASGAVIGSLTCPVVGAIAGGVIGIVVSWGLDGLTSNLKENAKKLLSDTLK